MSQNMISDLEKYLVSQAMMRWGGSFVMKLGDAIASADQQNLERIKSAFPDYWQKYHEVALDAGMDDSEWATAVAALEDQGRLPVVSEPMVTPYFTRMGSPVELVGRVIDEKGGEWIRVAYARKMSDYRVWDLVGQGLLDAVAELDVVEENVLAPSDESHPFKFTGGR